MGARLSGIFCRRSSEPKHPNIPQSPLKPDIPPSPSDIPDMPDCPENLRTPPSSDAPLEPLEHPRTPQSPCAPLKPMEHPRTPQSPCAPLKPMELRRTHLRPPSPSEHPSPSEPRRKPSPFQPLEHIFRGAPLSPQSPLEPLCMDCSSPSDEIKTSKFLDSSLMKGPRDSKVSLVGIDYQLQESEVHSCIRDALGQIQPQLVQDLDVPPVLDHLLLKKCITGDEYTRIQAQKEKRNQVQELLDIVYERSSRHTYMLIQALQLHQFENQLDKVAINALARNGKAQLSLVVQTPTGSLFAAEKLRKRYFEKLGDVLFDYEVILTRAEKGSLRLMLLFVTLEVLLMFVEAFNDGRVPQAISSVFLEVDNERHTFLPLVRSSIDAVDLVNAARQLGPPEQDLELLRKRYESKVPLKGGLDEEGSHAELHSHMSTLMSSLPYKVNEALFDRRLISYDEYMMTREEAWHNQNKMMYKIALSKTDEGGVKKAVCEGLCESSQYCPFAPPEKQSQPLTDSEHDELLYRVRPRLKGGHEVSPLLDRMEQEEIVDGFMRDFITAPNEKYKRLDRLMMYVTHIHSLAYGKFRRAFLELFPRALPE